MFSDNAHMNSIYLLRPGYRSDIDGLRAIAVLAVVAFHAFPAWIAGGFIGVDVFFVISGYLISGIVLDGLDSGTFAFGDFYLRRIRRIFPALFLVLGACLAVGWFALLSDEYTLLGKHVAGGAVFASNFILRGEAGYFATAAESKQLLHLWSLAIEEQFYIVWPLMLWIVAKFRWNVLIIISLAVLASFGLNVLQAAVDLSADFYSPQTRFWELMSGGALACIARQRSGIGSPALNNLVSGAGVLLLAGGFWLLDKEIGFPGTWALIPVLGTIFIIHAGPNAWINRVLSHKALVSIGLISFPLYLWHWPLLSFLRTVLAETPPLEMRFAAVALSALLAWLTYRFVETPVRFGAFGKTRISLLVALVGIVGILGLNVVHREGFASRRADEFVRYFNGMGEWTPGNGVREAYRQECNFLDVDKEMAGIYRVIRSEIASECYVRDWHKDKAVFIWGDSHAQQLYYGLSRQLSPDWQVLQVATSGCGVDITDQMIGAPLCAASYKFAKDAIARAKPDVVLISQRLPLDADVAAKFNKLVLGWGARQVIFVGPVTRWQSDLAKMVARKFLLETPRYTFSGLDMAMYDRNVELKRAYAEANINYIDVMSLMCNKEGCLTYLGNDVRAGLTSRDYGHLLPVASDFIAKNLLVPQIYRAARPSFAVAQ